MRTTIVCLLLSFLFTTVHAEAPRCKLTILWESDHGFVSVSFPCDWAGTAMVEGDENLFIVWGRGDKPRSSLEMFRHCSGWRHEGWTRAFLEVIR
jgi:hypothetical protein